jgi:hypothetical protein
LRDTGCGTQGTRGAIFLHRVALWCAVVFLTYSVVLQGAYILLIGGEMRSHGVEKNSRYLEELVPESDTVYMQCYGFRFFWQARRRIISGDDQIMDNQMVLAKAIEEKGRFVLLYKRIGAFKKYYKKDIDPDHLEYSHARRIGRFSSNINESGNPYVYVLFEMTYPVLAH